MGKKFLIMAGGTGGHVFPALAIAKELQSRGHETEWLGTRGRLEEKIIPEHGIRIHYIDIKGVRRNGIGALIKTPFMLLRAVAQARKVIKEFKPDAVIGFGGYASAPGGMAARLCGIPLILHEQNAAAGLTNRILFKFADHVLLGVGHAFSGNKVQSVGNPVRAEILALMKENRSFMPENKIRILIVGGSLGAQALNEKLPAALIKTAEILRKDKGIEMSVRHQCGQGNSEKTGQLYEKASFKADVSDFITDMADAYRNADIIICRAGALTVSEVSVAGLPAVFVPLPTAVDDHQTKNAAFLKKEGAAEIIAQKDLNDINIMSVLLKTADRDILQEMSEKALSLAVADACVRVCDIAEQSTTRS